MTRLKMSRPSSSVPNQCKADGALRTLVQLCATGSYGVTRGAKIASRMNSTITARPNTAPLRRNSRRVRRRHGVSIVAALASGMRSMVASAMRSAAQPWIDQDVGDIGEQIERDVDRRRDQHDALHDRVVAIE